MWLVLSGGHGVAAQNDEIEKLHELTAGSCIGQRMGLALAISHTMCVILGVSKDIVSPSRVAAWQLQYANAVQLRLSFHFYALLSFKDLFKLDYSWLRIYVYQIYTHIEIYVYRYIIHIRTLASKDFPLP